MVRRKPVITMLRLTPRPRKLWSWTVKNINEDRSLA